MGTQPRSRAWLQKELAQALSGWDPSMVGTLVDTATGDKPRSDVEEMMQAFLVGEPTAVAVMTEYLDAKDAVAGGGRAYIKAADSGTVAGASGGNRGSSSGISGSDTGGGADAGSSGQKPAQPAKVLGMFKEGRPMRKPAEKPGGKAAGRKEGASKSHASLMAELERKVVNCLGCGKIYDCRGTVTSDVQRFLDTSGTCTFCGTKVALTYSDWNAQQDASTASTASPSDPSNGATASAIAFKDRLVEYDRNAAQRTQVIDDQSDFFEIDTNAWLTDQEREELRRRKQLEDEAEEARRSRVTVTIDLIGRRVLVPDGAPGGSGGDGDGTTGFETSSSMEAARAEQAGAARAARDAAAAQAAPWRPAAAGASAGPAASAEQLSKAVEALREMRVTINPHLAAGVHTPVFTPAAPHNAPGGDARGTGQAGRRTAPSGPGRRDARGATAGARLQGDLFEEFDEFGMEVMYDDVIAAAAAMEPPFDLCPPEMRGMAPIVVPPKRSAAQALATNYVRPDQLPRGMCLLKGFLSVQQQVAIINELRTLGMGPGGFYTPSYKEGGQLALRMMCLGRHWEPRLHAYEDTRSAHDGATPPGMLPSLLQLSADVLRAAEFESGFRQPGPFVPDVCLVNHYEKTGRLGYHQDKDETAESLKKQLPVVSLSIGDACDFLFGTSRDEAEGSLVRLESGDALVFGGPSRMVFHAVPTIHVGTAPQALIDACGLRPGRLNLTMRKV